MTAASRTEVSQYVSHAVPQTQAEVCLAWDYPGAQVQVNAFSDSDYRTHTRLVLNRSMAHIRRDLKAQLASRPSALNCNPCKPSWPHGECFWPLGFELQPVQAQLASR